jgi:hypothetical protein
LLFVGCFDVSFTSGTPCSVEGKCPGDQICAEQDNRCYNPGEIPDFTDGGGNPDGMDPEPTRIGTVSLTQVTVHDEAVGSLDIRGAAFAVRYRDVSATTIAPSFTDNASGTSGCTVFEYAAPGMEPTRVDEGPVDVSGFGGLGDFSCSFVGPDRDYRCVPENGATGEVSVSSPINPSGGGLADVTINGTDFTMVGASGARGMTITFPDGTWPIASNDGTFPIVRVLAADTISIANEDAVSQGGPAQTNDYSIVLGDGPIEDTFGDPYHVFENGAGNPALGAFTISGGDLTHPLISRQKFR